MDIPIGFTCAPLLPFRGHEGNHSKEPSKGIGFQSTLVQGSYNRERSYYIGLYVRIPYSETPTGFSGLGYPACSRVGYRAVCSSKPSTLHRDT